MKKFNTVDEYINDTPSNVKARLIELRKLIKELAPDAEEGMGYGMPGYKLNGPLVYFAAFKNHISFFPTSSQIDQSIKELAKYRTGKGTFQFPLNQPLPMPLIKRAVELRVKENLSKKK